jgi:hypothetical protein
MVINQRDVAGSGQWGQPGRELREEMADGFEEGLAQGYDLPCRRRWAVTWVLIRASVSWVISWASCLRRPSKEVEQVRSLSISRGCDGRAWISGSACRDKKRIGGGTGGGAECFQRAAFDFSHGAGDFLHIGWFAALAAERHGR